jgi:hypothetical protein
MAQNKFTEYVATLTGLTATQHKVLKAIAQFTDNKTGECFPSMTTISAATDLAKSTVQIAIDNLCEAGHLEIVGRRATKHASVNVYRVVVSRTDSVVPMSHTDSSRTDTDSPSRTDSESSRTDLAEVKQEQRVVLSRTDDSSRTDRYRTDQVVSSGFRSSPVEQETTKPNLISTDAPDYPQMIVDRFARYKNPGKDALLYAKEIFVDSGLGIGKGTDPARITHLGVTAGELAYRHIVDIIGFVFEIQINDPKFRYAERTYTLKNLRDHLCKPKSPLESCYIDFCTDWEGAKQGNRLRTTRGSVSYAMQTLDDPQASAWGAAVRQRIKEYQACKAKAGE